MLVHVRLLQATDDDQGIDRLGVLEKPDGG
jgi:hypothetical protein